MFRDYVNECNADDVLFISPSGVTCTAGQLHSFCSRNEPLLAKTKGKNLSLLIEDDFSLALYLILLDGNCRRMTLLPSNEDPEQIGVFLSKSETDILISSRNEEPYQVETLPVKKLEAFAPDLKNASPDKRETVDTEWIITTSGTTGDPKLVRHTVETLTRTAKRRTSSSNAYSWGLLYRLTRFAGLQVLFQSVVGGSRLIFPAEGGLSRQLGHFAEHGCNALSATPTMWRKILMQPNASALQLKQITLGGEIADDTVLAALRAVYPDANIRHIYASTEAGVGFSVNDGRAGFPAAYLTSPPSGIEMAVDPSGILLLRSDRSSAGYLASDQALKETSGFVNTGDRVEQRGDRFYFLGRDNGSINVGGNKVQPEEVEQVLNSMEGVLLSSVSARSSRITGSLIEAKIVIDPGIVEQEAFIKRIRAYCRSSLVDYKMPAFIKIVSDLETNTTGKIIRA